MAHSPDDERDDEALRNRLDKLSKSLGPNGPSDTPQETGSGDSGFGNAMGAGVRVVAELVAGVLVGGGLGWLADRALNTKPLMMIILGSLGLVGGFWNIIRAAMRPPGSGRGRFGS